jgi:formylglycine-generating enzyme required for sulfatase activity
MSSAADSGPVSSTPPPPPATGPCGATRVADDDLADDEVCVRAGSFDMGSSLPPTSGYFAHGPVHSVTLSAYLLDAYEVTVARYRRCVQAGACDAPSSNAAQGCSYTPQAQDHEKYPVTCVAWQSAQDFCSWDGGRQLPTEAQWEQAARNAAGSKYPWGDAFSCDRAVLAGASQCQEYSGQLPKPVGSARNGASPERVYDLTGNAAEWVADWFGSYAATALTDPTGPATGSARIQRGGGWLTIANDAASYARRGESPAAIGPFSFRCARTPEP